MTEDEIRMVHDATDLAELVGEDLDLRTRGNRQWACCPFHDERAPSFMVDHQTQRYRCFGCGVHGDAIDYVMRRRDLSFVEAVTFLAERAGIELGQERGSKGKPSRERLQAAMMLAARHAHSILTDDGREDARRVRKWLEKHGIGDATIGRWGIGYAPGNGEICRALRKAGFATCEMRSCGMCHDHGDVLRNVVCAPVNDATGKVVALAGQTTGERERVFVGGIPSSLKTTRLRASEGRRPTVACHGTLFGLEGARDAIRESGEAIVTLGPLDAITLHERGMRNVVSCMGGGIGTKAARALVTIGAKGVVLLFPTNGRANQATHASLGAALSVPARLSLARIEGSDTLSALMGLDVGDVKTFCDEAPEIVSAALDGVVGCFDLDSPQELIEAASKACAAFATAVDGDRARAGLVAGLVAGRLGIRDPTALTHALLADGPVGRPEKVPGIDPLPIENPRRSLPMARVTIDLPLPDLPHTSLAEEAVGARIASDNLAIGAHMRHGREPTPPHTPPHSQTKQE